MSTNEGDGTNVNNEKLKEAQEYLELLQNAAKERERELELLKKTNEQEAQKLDLLGASAKAAEKRLEIDKKISENAYQQFTTEKSFEEMRKKGIDMFAELSKIAGRTLELTEEQKQQLLEGNNMQEYAKKLMNERLEQLKKQNQYLQNAQATSKKIGSAFGITADASETWVGKLMDGNLALGMALRDTLSLQNIFANVVTTIGKMVMSLDEAGKKLGQKTGLGNMSQQLLDLQGETLKFGASIEENSAAMSGLINNFSGFDRTNKKMVKSLGTTVTGLAKLGVSAADSAQMIDFFNKAIGKSPEEAAALTTEIATMGRTMGVTSKKMISDFKSIEGDLALSGDRMMDTFKGLASQARATGVAISELVAVGKQFDQFDSAADSASKLNAVLGSNISTIDMMNMEYDERIEYLQRELKSVGANMDTMDRYTKMYVANALGVKDAATAQRILNQSQADIAKNKKLQEEAAMRQEKMLELTQELIPVMDRLKLAFTQIAVEFKPVLEFILLMVDKFDELNKMLDGKLVPIMMGLVALYGVLNLRKKANIAFMKKEILHNKFLAISEGKRAAAQSVASASNTTLSGTNTVLGASTRNLGKSLLRAAMGMFVFAAAVALISWAYTNAAAGGGGGSLNELILGSVVAFAGLAAIAAVAGQALTAALPGLLGIAAVFATLGFVATSVAFMFQVMAENADLLFSISGAMGVLAVSFGLLGVAGAVGAKGLLTAAVALGAVAAVLGLAGVALGDVLKVGDTIHKAGMGVQMMATGLKDIVAQAAQLSGGNMDGFVAISSEGGSTNVIMGSNDVMSNFVDGKISVDVNVPKMEIPTPEVHIYLNEKEFESFIKQVVNNK